MFKKEIILASVLDPSQFVFNITASSEQKDLKVLGSPVSCQMFSVEDRYKVEWLFPKRDQLLVTISFRLLSSGW